MTDNLKQLFTVLVVDDDPANILTIKASLEDSYKLRVATSGVAALKAATVFPVPDLVILDIMMPGMDGYEVCRRLKDDGRTAGVPVIFLTGKSEVADEARGFLEGAVDYIHKPISPPILQARVKTHLALKQARDLLARQNEHLEEVVQQRTAELAAALDQAVAAGKAKTAFLQTMSHELRTPLNHILGYAEMLQEELEESPDLLKDLNRIRSSGKHLLEMIDRVLEFARNEGATAVTVGEVDVLQVAQEAAQLCEQTLQKNSNLLELKPPAEEVRMLTQPDRLRSALAELISNAAKFCTNGTVSVTIRPDATEYDQRILLIDVSDTGIGMSQDEMDRCFDAFWQADGSNSRAFGGTGMGLASAKQIAQQLGGDLSVASEPGKGSTFTLRLPL